MSDNVTVGGSVFAADEVQIEGLQVKVARDKVGFGEPGSYADVSGVNPLPVALDDASLAALENVTVAINATLGSPLGVRLSDGSSAIGTTAQRLHVDDGGQSLTVDGAVDTNALGTWGYKAGTSGTPTLTGKRVVKISALGGASDGSLTINGGDSITIKANTPFGIELRGNLAAPTLVFTGTVAYFVETIG